MSQQKDKNDGKQVSKEENKSQDTTTIKADNIVLMKKGDYSIHVLIEEIKNCAQIEEDHLPYPIVKITCFNNISQRTEKPSIACTEYTYNEHFYFEKTNLSIEEIDSAKIIIEVYDSENARKREDFFGVYEFDMEYVYSQPNHALKNFWLALANPESEDMTKVRGYLKLSISVLNDNDPRVELETNDSEDNQCVLPSQINMEYKQISLNIFRAEGIPDMDSMFSEKKINRECDGYIEVKYLGLTRKTSIVKMKNDVLYWNEAIDIPVSIPAVSQRIVMTVKDNDLTGDDIVGSLELNVNDILQGKYTNFRFFNIYGSPLNKKGTYFDKMNQNAEIGSRWKGRVLMKIEFNSVDSPSAKKRKITDELMLKQANEVSRKNLWSIYFKLYSGFYLPEDNGKYSVKVEIQDNSALFPEKKCDKGNIDWKMNKTIQCQTLTDKINELPDLFIYLLNSSGDPVCFQRIKPSEFHLNNDIMIIKLIPDPCINKVNKLVKSGLLKIKACVVNKAIDGNNKNLDFLQKFKDGDSNLGDEEDDLEALAKADFQIQKNMNYYTLVAIVYMTRYMISKDPNGKNDPYVSLKCVDNEQITTTKYDSVNGIWNEKLIFDSVSLDIQNKSTWPILLCKINDYDKLSKDDLMGYSYIWLSEANFSINSTDLVRPKWHHLFLPKSNRQQGEILISFYIFDSQHRNLAYEIQSIPETVPYSFEINILGLRDLKPLSIIPVKKAFIKFDMNSLNVTGQTEDNILPIKTLPKDNGANPTINTVIKFDIKLPKEDIFMPELQCEVYDHLLSGIINPLLGIFMLNVREIVLETNRQIEEDLRATKKKIGLFLAGGIIKQQVGNVNLGQGLEQINTGKKDVVIEMQDKSVAEEKKVQKQSTISALNYSLEEIEKNKNDPNYFVILPQFKTFTIPGTKKGDKNYQEFQVEDISKAPDDVDYFAIGYIGKREIDPLNSTEAIQKDMTNPINYSKHYRRIYRKGLEFNRELGLRSPFTKSFLSRGADEDQKDENALFEAISNVNNKIIKKYATDEKGQLQKKETKKKERRGQIRNNNYGKFKGVIRICQKTKMNEYEKVIQDYKKNNPLQMSQLKNLNRYETLTRNILVKHKVLIRIYVLELNDLAKKDQFSESDPYIKIYLGEDLKVNEQKNRIDDVKHCKWYKHYDILSELPGDSTLTLEVWDYDPVFADELIGATKIDLEDRYFNQEWREMKYKPIEIRTLRHPDSEQRGQLALHLGEPSR